MNRIDRALGILLLLRTGRAMPAAELARRFEVSRRTIYRDIDALAELGLPVYAEMGRSGGFRLLEGFFLPPVTFSEGEAISLLLGLDLLRRLRTRPFAAEQDSAGHKLLAAVPEHLRAVLDRTQHFFGFEALPADIFHPEKPEPESLPTGFHKPAEAAVLETFLRGWLAGRALVVTYRSPYGDAHAYRICPLGMLWDRDRWYLVATRVLAGVSPGQQPQLWRADRVLALDLGEGLPQSQPEFDVTSVLGRRWLGEAMADWRQEGAVVLRVTARQADRLRQDWYYGHALFDLERNGSVRITFGEDDQAKVFELLRWLGPGAELIEPTTWRAALRAELVEMVAINQEQG